MADVLLALFSALIGGILSFLATWLFYRRSSKELSKEASKLGNLTVLILDSLEESELVRLTRDEEGNPVGLVIQVTGISRGSSTVTARATVRREEDEASTSQEPPE